jgi:hypothetical protein
MGSVGSFASAVRARSRASNGLGIEAMLLDVAPATALALPSVIVIFAATSSAASLAMVERVAAAAAACARDAGVAPPIAVMDAKTDRGLELAQRLGVEVRGRGETCWLSRGSAVARTDAHEDDKTLCAFTLALLRNAAT